MEKIIVQIYEVQGPGEVERLINLGVDHIGSVILDRENWCAPAIREVVRLTSGDAGKKQPDPAIQRRGGSVPGFGLLRARHYPFL